MEADRERDRMRKRERGGTGMGGFYYQTFLARVYEETMQTSKFLDKNPRMRGRVTLLRFRFQTKTKLCVKKLKSKCQNCMGKKR